MKGGRVKCQEPGCDGEVDVHRSVFLRISCVGPSPAYPCQKCGRLHWDTGLLVFNRGNQRAFLRDGEVTHI